MKRTRYTHAKGYTVYSPQGIPLFAYMAQTRKVCEQQAAPMLGGGYTVGPVVLCHPRYFRATKGKRK